MALKFKIRAKVGTYMKDGVEKNAYKDIGAVFEKDGQLSGKLELIPAGAWDGFFYLNTPEDRAQQQGQGGNGGSSIPF
jgi:hypothetical protein